MTDVATVRAPRTALGNGSMQHIVMVLGFGSVGVSAFALLAAGPRLLGPNGYTSLALTWTVVTIIGIGIAAPGEQTITRGIASGSDDGVLMAVARRLAVVPLLTVLLLPTAVMVLNQEIQDAALWTTTLTVSAIGWALLACVRGMLAGRGRFGMYAVTLLTEATGRIALVVLAVLVPSQAMALLAGAVVLPLVAAGAVGWWALRDGVDLAAPVYGEDSRREHFAITAVAVLGQICLSTAPLWLQWQSTDRAIAGAFVTATSYMRIPLLLAGGLYGPTLSDPTRQFAARSRAGVLSRTGIALLTGVGGVGAVVVLLLVAAGPALTLLYGSDSGLSIGLLAMLGLATVGAIASNILTQVLYGCERAPSAVLAGFPAAAITTLLYALAAGDVERLGRSMAAGQLIAALGLLALLPRSLPQGAPTVRSHG